MIRYMGAGHSVSFLFRYFASISCYHMMFEAFGFMRSCALQTPISATFEPLLAYSDSPSQRLLYLLSVFSECSCRLDLFSASNSSSSTWMLLYGDAAPQAHLPHYSSWSNPSAQRRYQV